MVVSVLIHGTVLTLALSSVSLMGAGLASAVIIKVMNWSHTATSLACAMVVGLLSAIVWKYTGMATYFNEAGVGIVSGLVVNLLLCGNRRAQVTEPTLLQEPVNTPNIE